MNILQPSTASFSGMSRIGLAPSSHSLSSTSEGGTLTEMVAERARFLTRPQLTPSGVSEGQILPKWVAWRSLASKLGCDLLSGDWTRLRWLRVLR